jgi:hypothetical protein
MTEHAGDCSSIANVLKCAETLIVHIPNKEDNSGHIFDTE